MAQFALLRFGKIDDDETRPDRRQSSPMRLILKEADGTHMISAPLTDSLIVGRGDEAREPDVDLTDLNGVEFGISRWHAEFTYEDAQLYVEDLNSTNGTKINGYRIDPGKTYHLRNGDELELGHLRLIVQVVRPPG